MNKRRMNKEFREALQAMEEVTNQRNIVTKFYGHSAKIILFTNRAKHAENAVYNAQRHMESNEYSAFVAVIYDAVTAQLYATIRRTMEGDILVVRHDKKKQPPTVLLDFPEGLLA